MSVLAAHVRDRRAERNAATRREILDAAWALVRADGLGSLSMRDLGARVGMRAQSLYAYFPSKFAIYDAMFEESNRELLHQLHEVRTPDPVAALRRLARVYLTFCVEDPARYQLLYQRTIPGYEPSSHALAPALAVLDITREALRSCGISGGRAVDLWTAVIAGLAVQQTSNEPLGSRWVRLSNEAADMFLAYQESRGGKR